MSKVSEIYRIDRHPVLPDRPSRDTGPQWAEKNIGEQSNDVNPQSQSATSTLIRLCILLPALTERVNVLLMAALYGAGMLVVAWPRSTAREMEDGCPGFLRSVLLAVMSVWAILSFTGVGTFIYSNF